MATVVNWAGAAVRGLAWLAEVLRCTVMRGWPREGREAVRRERGKMSSSAWDTEEVGATRAPIDTLCHITQSAYYKDERAGKTWKEYQKRDHVHSGCNGRLVPRRCVPKRLRTAKLVGSDEGFV
jgi:hypothetical protein